MNNSAPDADDFQDASDPESAPSRGSRPRRKGYWVTTTATALCIAIFVGLTVQGRERGWETLLAIGGPPAEQIWKGKYWALVTSAFFHFELWHLAFNLYWLWKLGNRMEQAIGSVRFLLFILCAAFVSSSCQLAVSDSAGIGFSGVGYGIFGFMWIARWRYPGFREVLDQRIAMFFMVWLVGCAVATRLNLLDVANTAHFSGLLFGAAVAGCLAARARPHRWLNAAGLATLCVGAVVLLFWNPWNVAWLSMKAYDAHLAGHYADALQRYDRILAIDPGNDWAVSNRALCATSLH